MADGRIGFAATELLFDDANPYVDGNCSLMSTEFYAAPMHRCIGDDWHTAPDARCARIPDHVLWQ